MSSRSRWAIALLLVFLSAAAAQAATVHGTVSSESGGRLASKVVAAYDTSGNLRGTATTTATGEYFLDVPAGSYRLLAYDNEGVYATAFYAGADSFESTPIVQVTSSVAFTANFVLPLGGTARGVVLTPNGPLAGAIVEAYNLSGTRRGFTTTNAGGEYSLVLPAGAFKLIAYDANGVFAGEFHDDARAFADAVPVSIMPQGVQAISFALERAARVTGTISDAATNIRLGGMLVYAYTAAGALVAQTQSDPSGTFRFNLGPGQYRFLAADPDLVFAPAFYATSSSFERSDVVTLTAGQERNDLRLVSARGAVISGHVTGPANAIVAAYNLDGTLHNSTTLDASGQYRFVVAPGVYKLAVIDPAGVYATEFYPDVTHFGAAREVRMGASQPFNFVNFTPARAGRFAGTVRDVATQAPLSGMTVAAYDATGALIGQTTTAANGTYSLPLAPGAYRLLVFDTRLNYAAGYANGATSFETTALVNVAADATVTADLGMRRGTRVTGTVTANGVPVDGAEVFALDAAGNRVAGAMVRAGAFTIVVAPGTYRFQVIDPRSRYFPSEAITVAVGSQSPAPIAFTVTPGRKHRAARH
jgi:large repetitive protein